MRKEGLGVVIGCAVGYGMTAIGRYVMGNTEVAFIGIAAMTVIVPVCIVTYLYRNVKMLRKMTSEQRDEYVGALERKSRRLNGLRRNMGCGPQVGVRGYTRTSQNGTTTYIRGRFRRPPHR